jgi:hypothetical protein
MGTEVGGTSAAERTAVIGVGLADSGDGSSARPVIVGQDGVPLHGPGCSVLGHDWSPAISLGAAIRHQAPEMPCSRPNLLRCKDCYEHLWVRCQSTRASRCISCAETHRRDVACIGRSGAMDSPTGFFFVTLTAPGADVLPWDLSKCSHGPGVACAGPLGCVVDAEACADWNGSAAQRWSWFVTYVRREFVGHDLQFFKTWETQKRGVLHLHAMVRCSGVVSRRRMRAVVSTCALEWQFGRQVDVQHISGSDVREVARKAGYCAKYASKTADEPPETRVLDRETGEVAHPRVRPWSASRGWGDTMRGIRERRRCWVSPEPRDEAGVPGGAAALDLNSDRYTQDPTGAFVVVSSVVPSLV